jgi:hypothetical protein
MKAVVQATISVLVGCALSYVIGFSAAGMAGAGHGWCSAGLSIYSIFFLPLTGLGFVFFRRRWSRYMAGYITLGCIVLDAAIYVSSQSEGWSYFHKARRVLPGVFFSWSSLWLLWHAVIAALWLRLICRSERGAPQSGGSGMPFCGPGASPPSVS